MENIQENSENNKPKEDVDYIKTVKCIKTPKSELNDKKITCIIRKYYEVSKGFFESNYISYEIFTQECSWVANRRYSDFIWLRDCLRMLFPAEIVPMLPKKKIGNRRFDDDFILKRLKHLQNFLNIIVQNENFKSCSPLYLFLSIGDRTVFEQHMKEIVPIPFPSIETLLNFEGNVKIIDFENEGYQFQESFYKNINKYFKVQNESLIELRKNVKEYFGYLNEAGNCLTNIRDIFGKLHTLNKQATIVRILI